MYSEVISMYEDEFPLRLAQLRTKKGVSAREMSLAIGQNAGYINNVECGKIIQRIIPPINIKAPSPFSSSVTPFSILIMPQIGNARTPIMANAIYPSPDILQCLLPTIITFLS